VRADVRATEAAMDRWIAVASCLALGIAAFGGALGQGRALGSALEAVGRNPGAQRAVFTPLIIGLSLIESLVIYTLIVALAYLLKVR
jgi:F-type H+-transporting ATPase subunit c